ncbi:NADH dehydrogenase ubiquinone Fe-S protein 4 [Mesorhizobium yinganensis]|uniref:NADH dehydrogenase ubiquinone Fe-S protein 4 n=1 Tax=Mesorhizobium yinganensis TaxID=3157707 RepID=UPI0032B7AACA
METLHENKALYERMTPARPGNDNRPASFRALSFGRSVFPEGTVARIYRPGRSVTTSARTRSTWRLTFEHRTAPFIEPLMGYTCGRDTLTQVELSFPTLESAVGYAERQGLNYVVRMPVEQVGDRLTDNDERLGRRGSSMHTFIGLDAGNPPSHIFARSLPIAGAAISQPPEIVRTLEVSMSARTFDSPVFVRAAEGLIQEIACLDDAFDFLDAWPEHRRGVIYETARRACCRAFDGLIPLKIARDAIAGFARSVNILEDVVTPMPWMAIAKAGETGGVAA